MKQKTILTVCTFLLMLSMLIMPASAWGPVSHFYLGEELFANSDAAIIEECREYKAEFLAGMEVPDFTVAYYYQSGGQNYKLTHNWNFQEEVLSYATTQGERCYAYGIGVHQIQDGVAHVFYVPMKIKQMKLPNWLIHPISEQSIDTILSAQYPEMAERSRGMLDVLFDGKHEHYFVITQKALGANSKINAKQEIARLRVAVGGGRLYDDLYTVKGAELFGAYAQFATILQTIGPYIGISDLGEAEFYMNKVYADSDYTLKNWGLRYSREPHGFTALGEADAEVVKTSLIFVVLMVLAMLAIALFAFTFLRKIPILLRIPVIIVIILIFVISLVLLFLMMLG